MTCSDLACSFCDKSGKEVAFMVAREDVADPPAICDQCVAAAAKAMAAAGWQPTTVTVVV